MNERKINLEEILSHYVDTSDGYISDFSGESFCPIEAVECAMREFGKQLLKLAAENAKVEEFYRGESYRIKDIFYNNDDSYIVANKQSILDTIKQVE